MYGSSIRISMPVSPGAFVYPGATQLILRQPIRQRRRQQHHLAAVTRDEILTHPRMVLNDADGTA
jgi:hypothetical protein